MHIINQLFNEMDKQKIEYVHFKSNVNLEYSFNDKGDFDVLVDSKNIDEMNIVLSSLQAKQVNTINDKKYPGVDNWLLFDAETGIIHHLHLHYQLMSGKQFVKEYSLPWTDIFLENRIIDSKWNLYIANPSLELVLLNTRTIIKAHLKDYIRALFGIYSTHKYLQQERIALIEQINKEDVDSFLKETFPINYSKKLLEIMIKPKLKSREFLKLSKIVRSELANSRRYNGVKSCRISTVRKIKYYLYRINRKKGYKLNKKTLMSRGKIIAFVGVDGSGKSTMATEINKWLGQQLESRRIYMGLGDGKTSLLASVLKRGRKVVGNNNKESINSKNYKAPKTISFWRNPILFIKKILLIIMLHSVEKDNYKKIIKMNKFRINGGIAVLDRYPQIEYPNRNDGPKIVFYKDIIKAKLFMNNMVKKEEKLMSIVKSIKPDIIFRLNITPDESMKRKQDQTDKSVVESKINDLKSITFQDSLIYDINAMQPYETELLEIKKMIWNNLNN